jgi:LmbE family N-acetylglucosaminyl deacetylase
MRFGFSLPGDRLSLPINLKARHVTPCAPKAGHTSAARRGLPRPACHRFRGSLRELFRGILPSRNSERRPRWLRALAIAGACLPAFFPSLGRAAEPVPAPVILQDLREFREMGSVLFVAAHPDDENTLLIAYLSRGRDYRTAYLSVTRADGGQNVLGPEFGAELGVIRTEELLAARRIDGGRQFFTRAIDFGFSKDYGETLRIWNRQQVLSDIVRVIRTFRPDVVITRFAPWATRTHGHHTASAVLALEAFKLCGDPKAFPDQLDYLAPWQPKRILWNGRGGSEGATNADIVRLEISGDDPVLGMSFAEVAGHSRSMHKTQGFGNFTRRGAGDGPRTETFQLLAGEPATNDIMDGIDTTWSRVPGGAGIGKLAGEIIAEFNSQDPAASVPALLKLRSQLTALQTADPVVAEKRALLDRVLQACLGLEVETVIPQAEVVPGEPMKLHHSAIVRSDVPVRWLAVRYPVTKQELDQAITLQPKRSVARDSVQTLPADTPVSQPYWLREEGTPGTFRVDEPRLIGRPENPPVFPIEQVFEVGGQTLVVPDRPVQVIGQGAGTETRRKLEVIPPVSLAFGSEVGLFAPGASRPVEVNVTACRDAAAGIARIEAPDGWTAAPASQPFHLKSVGDQVRLKFTVTAPGRPATAQLIASAEIGGKRYHNSRVVIQYAHIPRILLQPVAALKAVSLDLATRGHSLGYLPGAGDSVGEDLQEMGYAVTTLADGDLTPEKLRNFDAVVVGVRAFNVRTNLAVELPALFAYVEAGGTVVAQYNRPNGLRADKIAPFDLRLSNERVTDEDAPVTFLAPDSPVLNTPNKITVADFAGWVQERGIYYPDQWDEHFTPILSCNDPGEEPLKGGLLVARYGKGYFVYTGLVFFRQLPAGVPGAYRLFANLLSLGK